MARLVANVEVKATAVPAETRRAAHAALSLAVRLLPFLPPGIAVRWFKEAQTVTEQADASLAFLGRAIGATDEHDHRFDGFLSQHHVAGIAYGPDSASIWVKADLSPRKAAWTTLHECRHRAQFAADRHRPDGAPPREITDARRAAMEQDADEFAYDHLDKVRW